MTFSNCKLIAFGLVVLGLANLGSSIPVEPVTQAPSVAPTVHPVDPVTQAPVSTVTPFPSSGQFCKGHKTGDYVIDPQDPHVYYECVIGHAIKFTCPDSALQGRLIFDPVKNVCVYPPEA